MKTLSQFTGFEYRSKENINGWPLIHINFGANPETGQPLVARGVVAIGNIAYGVVAIGAVAVGIVTLAGVGLGIISLAAVALGIMAFGAVAMGYEYALGAVVQSAKEAIGLVGLDGQLAVWSLIFTVSLFLIIVGYRKIKARKLQS